MTNDILEKVNQLPLNEQQEIENFINEIISRHNITSHDETPVSELRKKNLGWAKGKIWIADDFNDTPEEFKEYM